MQPAPFPAHRPRRLRRLSVIRDAVTDVSLSTDHLILPMFVCDAPRPVPVASMPEVCQWPVRDALGQIKELSTRGLRQYILFGVTPPDHKDARGSYAWSPDAPVNRLLREVRQAGLDVLMYADLCFCEYTSHGHCGPLKPSPSTGGVTTGVRSGADPGPTRTDRACPADVDNDATLDQLGKTARVLADCGADVVAPSGMMDGMVGVIRRSLDEAGHHDTAILAYSVKYASSLYGPFRDAGGGSPAPGSDRKGYQMDYRRMREWRTELRADVAQGADMVMVKPALAYLDILHQVRACCDLPVAAYHVSGEYAMLHAAATNGWLDLKAAALETTYAIRRAGADLILTYFAPRLLDWLAET